MLSLISPPRWETTAPVPSTASTPSTCARVSPYRRTCVPPALVATIPPTVADPRLARSIAVGPAGGLGGPVQRGEHDAGARGDLTGKGVDRLEGLQPPEAEDDLVAEGNAAADQSGVPALGNQGDAELPAGEDHTGDLLGGARPHHGGRASPEPPRPVRRVRGDDVGIDDHLLTDDLAQPIDDLPLPGHDHYSARRPPPVRGARSAAARRCSSYLRPLAGSIPGAGPPAATMVAVVLRTRPVRPSTRSCPAWSAAGPSCHQWRRGGSGSGWTRPSGDHRLLRAVRGGTIRSPPPGPPTPPPGLRTPPPGPWLSVRPALPRCRP